VTSACDAGAVGAGRRRCKLRRNCRRPSDTLARLTAQKLSGHLGEQFYVRLHGRKAAGRVAEYVCQRVLPLLEAGTKADVAGSPDRVTSRNTHDQQITSALPSKGDLSEASEIRRYGPMAISSGNWLKPKGCKGVTEHGAENMHQPRKRLAHFQYHSSIIMLHQKGPAPAEPDGCCDCVIAVPALPDRGRSWAAIP
jgi:hypothetical protein